MCSLQNQRTPLRVAVHKDNASLVKMLLSSGADINANIVSYSHKFAVYSIRVTQPLYFVYDKLNFVMILLWVSQSIYFCTTIVLIYCSTDMYHRSLTQIHNRCVRLLGCMTYKQLCVHVLTYNIYLV